ncbi:MAG: Wzz/FepE/Etk N-terminal domain-containing protein, partial [Polyangiaceae bacterium]|nr:Wzz/FepE/Etk N-terminal domain-containing protein [Polyangiaceae bacterium]
MEELKTQKTSQTPKDVLQRVGTMVRRTLRFWVVIAVAAGVGLVAFLLTPLVIPPVYESETVVLYREVIQAENLLGSQQYQMESGRQVGQRLREMLMSRTNLQKILEQHKLYQDIVESRGVVDAVETFRSKIDCKVREGETFT